jgi:thioredoxin-like negative regulator of GroEL
MKLKISKVNQQYLNYFYVFAGIFIFGLLVYFLLSSRMNVEMFSNDDILAYFYMESCPHCKDFDVVWKSLEKEVAAKKLPVKLVKYDIHAVENKSKVNQFNISGAPTVYFVGAKNIEFTGERNVEELVKFISASIA